MRIQFSVMLFVICLLSPVLAISGQIILSKKVEKVPQLDGLANDPAWASVKPVAVRDQASGATILLRSVYTEEELYFLVEYPDSAENPLHNPWLWNEIKQSYESGAHREDTFVFKWNMMGKDVNLSNFSDDDYLADIWYWKANRTNPAGYADDKLQELSGQASEKAMTLISLTGKTRYLNRRSDEGRPAYKEFKPSKFEGDIVDRYPQSVPEGSRSDVKAKGRWINGFWAIEFARSLKTENTDDLVFDPLRNQPYLFGVSIFSLYGKPHDPNSPNFYGRGRVSEPLYLSFQKP